MPRVFSFKGRWECVAEFFPAFRYLSIHFASKIFFAWIWKIYEILDHNESRNQRYIILQKQFQTLISKIVSKVIIVNSTAIVWPDSLQTIVAHQNNLYTVFYKKNPSLPVIWIERTWHVLYISNSSLLCAYLKFQTKTFRFKKSNSFLLKYPNSSHHTISFFYSIALVSWGYWT